MSPESLERLEMICRNREPRRHDLSIARLVGSIQSSSAKSHRKLGRFIDLWLALVPEELASHTRVVGLRAGVAQVAVDNASTKYELDRRLRGGLMDELRRRYPGTLARIKLRLDGQEDAETPKAKQPDNQTEGGGQ